MDSLTVYLVHVKELLNQKKYQRLWNECSQFYEFGTTSNLVDICLGPEFSSQSLTQTSYVNHLMNKHYYLPQKYLSDTQLQEFSQALDKADQYDQRNIGSIIGMILLAIIGFVGFGFKLFGIIVGGILGALVGRFLGQLIKRTISSKELLELDVFELRMLGLLRWAHAKREKYKFNLNLLRFVAEKILLESKIVLHYKQYNNASSRNRLKQLLQKIGLELNSFQQGIKLSLLLAKEELDILQKFSSNNNVAHFKEHRNELEICFIKSIDNVLKPMMSIMREMNQEHTLLYLEIRKFLLQQEVIQVSRLYPDPQMSVIYIKMIAGKMKQKIQTKNLKDYIKIQNFRDIENIGIYIQKQKTTEIDCEQQICIQECSQQVVVPLLIDEQQSLQLQIHKHPNRVFFQRLHQKLDSHETPIQSLQEIYQILEPEFPQEVQVPDHYSEQSKQKFDLFLNYFNEPTEDWELAVQSEDTVIYKTMKEGSESVFIRGQGIIKESTLENVVDAVYNVDRRRSWDELLQGFEVVQKECEDTDIVYYYVVPPVRFVTQREWLQRRILRRDYPKQGQICLLFYSVELKEFKVHKNRIRANTEISSMVFEEVQNGIRVSILSNNDIKGFIPKMIVNRASASGPVGWFSSLQKACRK